MKFPFFLSVFRPLRDGKREKYALFLSLMFTCTGLFAQETAPVTIIPQPVQLEKSTGAFILSNQTVIKADAPNDRTVLFLLQYLNRRFAHTGKKISVAKSNAAASAPLIVLTSTGSEALLAEGYRLKVTPRKVTIIGKGAGLLYGVQSFIQLLPLKFAKTAAIPCLTINDYPRFPYRGLMVDVARHFYSVSDIKTLLDLMASYKLNRFHFHLTDNEGWRIEIKKYPKLAQIGGFRKESHIGFNRDWFDEMPYGGYYKQEEIKDLVKYAQERYITIIPEIEIPAHSRAALRAYPELKCQLPEDVKNKELADFLYCPTEETFKFLEDVLTEVIDLFPSKLIHIGGDEADKTPWKQSAFTQKLIKDLKLKDEYELQSYFIHRIEKFVNKKGRNIIGWDEILEGGLAPNATVMSWRGEEGGIAAAKMNHDVIMAPAGNGLYLDHAQSTSDREPVNIGGFSSLQKTYSYDPQPKVLTPEEKKHIIGVQANIWTEYIPTLPKLQYMLLPRMLSLAEIAWTPVDRKNVDDFAHIRVPVHLARLDRDGFNYRVPTATGATDTMMIGSKFTFKLRSELPGAKIFFTINGRVPDITDIEYKDSLTFILPPNEKRELQTIVVTSSGNRSIATRTIMYNQTPLQPAKVATTSAGLTYQLYNGSFTDFTELMCINPTETGQVKSFSVADFYKKSSAFGIIYEGLISIEEAGLHTFSLTSDFETRLYIDDTMIIDNVKNQSSLTRHEREGAVLLLPGFHKVRIEYLNLWTGNPFKVEIRKPTKATKEPIEQLLYH
ncbi:hexosaminidase [Mucilaginibacter pineti]|uniref:beta-N-acetylhexosaminidase n=1 Tax=Mucilaginibacter pineti TaxID=1391627 RepID=A0A1G7CSW9_9SPHI|nr:family 20 glycosylhydrolase [Mucilaginibacter pineti]SDE41746.1 hexosaminidase [Mucilaginibacter pineti]